MTDEKNKVVDLNEERAERAFNKDVEDNAIHIYHLLQDVCEGLVEKYGSAEVMIASTMVAKNAVDGMDEKQIENVDLMSDMLLDELEAENADG